MAPTTTRSSTATSTGTRRSGATRATQCLQRLTFSGAEPTATFTSKPAAGNEVTFNATGSTAPGGVSRYDWQFNDRPALSTPVETTTPTISHVFPTGGAYVVALTVFAADGTSIGTARTIRVSPTAATGAASAVTQTSATLNATVNPNGAEVNECKLEYGTDYLLRVERAVHALTWVREQPGRGLGGNHRPCRERHLPLQGLRDQPGGTSKGSDQTFKTLPNPPTVVTEAASAVTQTTATLNATVNPNGGDSQRMQARIRHHDRLRIERAVHARTRVRDAARSRCPRRSRASPRTRPTTSGSPRPTPAARAKAQTRRSKRCPTPRRS